MLNTAETYSYTSFRENQVVERVQEAYLATYDLISHLPFTKGRMNT